MRIKMAVSFAKRKLSVWFFRFNAHGSACVISKSAGQKIR